MLDWLTLRLPYASSTDDGRDLAMRCESIGDRIMRFCPRTSEIRWESSAWDSVRSDSHQVSIRSGSDALWLQGSPARAVGDGDAVFGPPGGQSVAEGMRAMVRHASRALGFLLPSDPARWIVSRVDCTVHLLLSDLASVRVALSVLRGVEGGRYRVSQQAGDTVYWSHRSRRKAGKAYAKGPQLRYQMRQQSYAGRPYTDQELDFADRLLRLELRLGAQYLRELKLKTGHDVIEWTSSDIDFAAWSYFSRMLGDTEMTQVNDVEQSIRRVVGRDGAPITDGTARAALGTWGLISSFGWERAKTMVSRPTWYRHMSVLHAAGLSDADISAGRIVELRARRLCEAQRVSSWSDLRAA